eukprot:14570843-Alexandrium_andersonii.AAC.1
MAARRQVAPSSMAFTCARRRVEGSTSGTTGEGGRRQRGAGCKLANGLRQRLPHGAPMQGLS